MSSLCCFAATLLFLTTHTNHNTGDLNKTDASDLFLCPHGPQVVCNEQFYILFLDELVDETGNQSGVLGFSFLGHLVSFHISNTCSSGKIGHLNYSQIC